MVIWNLQLKRLKCHVLFSDFISLPVCDDYFILEKYTRNDRYYKADWQGPPIQKY